MIPITKLYIKFDVLGNTPYPIKSSKRPVIGTGVNFLEVLNFDILLPPNEYLIFSPILTIYLYDTVFGGMTERLIGLASFDLADILRNHQNPVKCKHQLKLLAKKATKSSKDFNELRKNDAQKQLQAYLEQHRERSNDSIT